MAKRKNPLGIAPYDAADYLNSPDEVAQYLKLAMKNAKGDAALIVRALGVAARARGVMQLAKETGMTRAGLYRALSDEGHPTFETVVRVMNAMGVQLTAAGK